MKRLILLVAALAVITAACSSSSEIVATVGEVDVTRSDIEGLVRVDADDISSGEFASFLGVFIQWEAFEQAANDDFGIAPTDDQVQLRLDQLIAEFGSGATLDDYLEAVNASEQGIRKYANQLVIQDEIEQRLTSSFVEATEAEAAAKIARDPLGWTEVCAAHILVETPEEADAVMARLSDGEDFAAVAANVSIDPGSGANGGDLGCRSPSSYVPEFADAPMTAEIGVPTDPVVSDYGSHIILVESRTTADTSEVLAYLNSAAERSVVEEWFLSVISASNVTVEPEFGEWITDPSPQVLPPT